MRRKAVFPSLYLLYLLFTVVVIGPLAGAGPALQQRGEGDTIQSVILTSYFGGLLTNLLFLGAALAAYLGTPLIARWSGYEVSWDRFKLRNPLTAGLFQNLYAEKLFGNLELAVTSGMPMPRAVELSASAGGSPYIRSRAPQMVRALDRGLGLAQAIEGLRVIPDAFLATLAVGEKAGRLDETLRSLSNEAREAAGDRAKVTLVAVVLLIALVLMGLIVSRVLVVFSGPLHYYMDLKLE